MEVINYKFLCEDPNYNDWSVVNADSLKKIYDRKDDSCLQEYKDKFKDLNPISERLINQDVFNIDSDNEIKIVYSMIRNMKYIPGILKLDGNRTFGSVKDKYYYRCFPDDKRYPEFLVPYKIKKMSFSKKQKDLFVLFHLKEWNDKHPIGTLINTVGEVDKLDNFYEYQLYCKSLYASIQDFKKATVRALKERSETEYINDIKEKNNIEDRQHYQVFSIDPPRSKDFDDAFSINDLDDGRTLISIYIANVSLWMEAMQLWDSFSERISTIYLPDQKRPMLPTILSDCLCSLKEHEQRFAFTMDLIVKDYEIENVTIKNTLINVYRNFRYEEKDLLDFPDYKKLLGILMEMRKKHKSIYKIKDSHDVVGNMMVLMNYYCAKEMIKYKGGIYRSVKLTSEVSVPEDFPESIIKFLKGWNSSGGRYALFNTMERHDLLELDSYIHITSPIRRLVDLLNIMQLQDNIKLVSFSETSKKFYDKWESRVDYINTTMRAIRKVQCDCSMLDLCVKDNSYMDKEYEGYIFDIITRSDGLFQAFVHLPEINMTTRYTSREQLYNFTKKRFKMYLFQDEHSIKRKIRLMAIE